jgi:hypothetical protein
VFNLKYAQNIELSGNSVNRSQNLTEKRLNAQGLTLNAHGFDLRSAFCVQRFAALLKKRSTLKA